MNGVSLLVAAEDHLGNAVNYLEEVISLLNEREK